MSHYVARWGPSPHQTLKKCPGGAITLDPLATAQDGNVKLSHWMLLIVVLAAVVVYAPALSGPFLFDDAIHITQNRWVKIDALDWASLSRAWHSSFSAFPASRPLAQLTFGINHALAGLDPWAFKATNLAIHLVTGLLIFVFTRLAYRAVVGSAAADDRRGQVLAAAATAVWLLHPLHVSTVLYTVQRMAQLSSLGMLAALTCYVFGRLRIAEGRPGLGWMLAAAPIALLGFLGKENAVLLPLLLLVTELTLLQRVPTGARRGAIRLIWAVFIALPLLAGAIYLLTHPGLISYDGRPFTLQERLLTQPRVLWLYLQWLFVPDISQMGLFHDDFALSSGLLDPPTTLIAILGLVGLVVAALFYRRRAPLFAFAVLFFLANHALESSVLPLEMLFEHRNYLAALGPLLFFAYLVTIASSRMNVRPLAMTLGVLLLLSFAGATYVRSGEWSSYREFIMSSVANHPESPRSNFLAAQLLISALNDNSSDTARLADAARGLLYKGLEVDARCLNCLFGLVILDLHLNRQPDPAVLDRLKHDLREGYVGPTKASVTQFSFLVNWQRSDAYKLPPADVEGIFDAALANPGWNYQGRAGIRAAYREYLEFVRQDLEAALVQARAAVAAWPQQWGYHMSLVQVLRKLGRLDEVLDALDRAAAVASNDTQKLKTAEVRASLATQAIPLSENVPK